MSAVETQTQPEFRGTQDQKKVARWIYNLMVLQGAFYQLDTPIRQTRERLVRYFLEQGLARREEKARERIEKAIQANPHIFARAEEDGEVVYLTTRRGRAPELQPPTPPAYTYPRFYEPPPEARQPRRRVRVQQPMYARYWLEAALEETRRRLEADRKRRQEMLARIAAQQAALKAALEAQKRAMEQTVKPVPPEEEVEVVTAEGPAELPPVEAPPEPTEAEAVVEAAEPVEAPPEPAEAEAVVEAAEAEAVEVPEAPKPTIEPVAPPEPVEVEAPPEPRVRYEPQVFLPDGRVLDLTRSTEELLLEFQGLIEDTLRLRLESDVQVAHFGGEWMLEEQVGRLSKGDLRRIQEYLGELGRPLSDLELLTDVLHKRPGHPRFEVDRFVLNYRLLREREFEFVGTSSRRLWALRGMVDVGNPVMKPADIAQDLAYLEEPYPFNQPLTEGEPRWQHFLTFYEYLNGMLPYDRYAKQVLPPPVEEGQRLALLTFRIPQIGEEVQVALHYPSEGRGGFLLGFEDFFQNYLVPGALVAIEPVEEDHTFAILFLEGQPQTRRLLTFDRKRKTFSFQDVTFRCAVDDALLLDEERFGALEGQKLLKRNLRRQPLEVLDWAFRLIGDPLEGDRGTIYWATLYDLQAAVNLQVPFSEEYLRYILQDEDRPEFYLDEEILESEGYEAYFYDPNQVR